MTEGIAAARLAKEACKEALDSLRRPHIDGEQVRNKLIEILDLVFSAQQALSDAEEENRNLRRTIDDRAVQETVRADMEYQQDGGYFVRKSERASGNTIPYCPTCYGATGKTVPLKPDQGPSYYCVVHRTSFRTQAAVDAETAAIRRGSSGLTR